ncbi:MAG: outer membrane lipoprotein LolB [Gammaproteobacteria bacterium]|nr:outer membrane lipoprotein LolB [Gammaproteobacteria bacterium]
MLLLVLTLPGCALRSPAPAGSVDWEQRRTELLAIGDWTLRGRFAVKAEGGGGQGSLEWRQQGEHSRIHLSGPFGTGAWEIDWDARSLTVRSRDGEVTRRWTGEDAAGQFLAEQLGWSFPAVSTRYWLLALADPRSTARETWSAEGRLAALEQNGWTVTYGRYVETAGLAMPGRIVLENTRARLRVVVDRWQL